MGALMTNTALTYDDLAEATAFMADRLLATQDQVLDLNQQLAAARGEVAALNLFGKLRRAVRKSLGNIPQRVGGSSSRSLASGW